MHFRMHLEGTTALLMHNPRMVDPNYELNRKIKELTKKKKKTDDDLHNIEWLEWLGGLYTAGLNGEQRLVQPTSKVRKCFIEAARITKEGKQVERALSFPDLENDLAYDGPRELKELFATGRHISRLPVVVSQKRIMRARPSFLPWKMSPRGILIPDAGLNPEDFERIAVLGGEAIGIGDNRINGYGRFKVIIEWLD